MPDACLINNDQQEEYLIYSKYDKQLTNDIQQIVFNMLRNASLS